MCGGEGAALRCDTLGLDRGGGVARNEVGLMNDGRGAERLESAGNGTGWWHWMSIDFLEGEDKLMSVECG